MNGSYPASQSPRPEYRKLTLCGLLAFAVVCSSAQPLRAEIQWRDIPDDFWAKSAIERLSERGILSESDDQRFYPYRAITRAEFASILAKALPQKTIATAPQRFSDVPKHHWAAQAVQTVVSQGWMSGVTQQQFRPNQILTMGELYATLGNIQPLTVETEQANRILAAYQDQDQLPEWARVPVAQAIASGLTLRERSRTRLSPNIPATRASVAACVAKALQSDQPIQTTTPDTAAPTAPHKPVSGSTQLALTQPAPVEEALPAANVVGQLAAGEEPDSWQLIRADGKRFRLDTQALSQTDRADWQVGQAVRVTGNVDALRGTADDPVLVVQTCHPVAVFIPAKTVSPALETHPEAGQNAEADTAPVTTANTVPKVISETAPEPSKASVELKLYFPNLANLVSDPSLMLGEAVAREGLTSMNPRQAVEAILGGPIESEKRAGYFMDQDLKRLRLDKFSLNESGLANVQLYAPGDFQFSNSSVPARLDEQIRRTLKQFSGIQRVKVSVKNPKDKVLWISP